MSRHQTFLFLLDQWGLRDVLLPFVLIFTFTFALLQKISLFKQGGTGGDANKPNKKINAIIAAGIGLAALIPHFTGTGFDIIVFMNNFLPQSFLLLLVVLLFLALVGTVTKLDDTKPSTHPLVGMIAFAAVLVLVLILLQSTQQINYPFLNFLNDPNTQAIAIVALVFILLIWYITKKELTPQERATKKTFDSFKKLMGKMFG
ncbi:hypothetical protein HY484_01495 [Candidatus Woesearchaeota archaeon]|nr:hypothetical protein [Candidatus Woesearchaeota archaeon]